MPRFLGAEARGSSAHRTKDSGVVRRLVRCARAVSVSGAGLEKAQLSHWFSSAHLPVGPLLLHRPTSFFFPDGEFCVAIGENSVGRFLCEGTRLVFANDVEGVDDAGDVTKDRQEEVDQEVSTAAALEENSKRREQDGEDDLADVRTGERHVDGVVCLSCV